ncbi:uncharacterized protein PADG_12345 [Paracoccidioides brasiliensis Pb18]|uniref:Uncharacterized protein n=2 Tax=Paracoccidioides brasiliensis TaxID=121759 RepID=A0A0A0HVV7_PARBD|nr:uncharacterized protein PADG_12345 [Paracoccidioides brasiliensis Pb18]KGM91570.1 hypothetical protein PADG_12345 [Paracoccidioides brasiliensis Pb18]ODH39898.1 hypothetical protein ACO22_01727 [Paracoccidioides brasiliensis]
MEAQSGRKKPYSSKGWEGELADDLLGTMAAEIDDGRTKISKFLADLILSISKRGPSHLSHSKPSPSSPRLDFSDSSELPASDQYQVPQSPKSTAPLGSAGDTVSHA